MSEVDPRGPRPGQALPDHPGHRLQDDRSAQVQAVDGVSFSLRRGETLGVVGESGCGKSTLAKLLMGLEQPTVGRDRRTRARTCSELARRELRRLRRNIQIVLQDPYTSLNPRMTVGDIVGEPFEIHPEVAPKGEPAAAGAGAARRGRAQPGAHQPVPAPVLRRSAPAHRHRPRARAAARDHRLRRAGLRAGRVDPGAGDEPAGEAAERVRPVVHLHRARPVGGAAHLRPGRGDVPRQDRRDRHRGRDLRAARRTRTPRRCCPRCRCRTRRCAGTGDQIRAGGRRAVPGQPAVGLPVPHPLLEGAGDLRRAGAAAGGCGSARRTRAPATSPRSARSWSHAVE